VTASQLSSSANDEPAGVSVLTGNDKFASAPGAVVNGVLTSDTSFSSSV
jgi:hypothetical protein